MSSPRYGPRTRHVYDPQVLPTHLPLMVIPRQSTTAQATRNVGSQELHEDEFLRVAQRWGWAPEQVEFLWQDMGISASTTTMEQRPALSLFLERLQRGETKAVLVSAVDRLFRDQSMIEPNRFIREMQRFDGRVLTSSRTFCFSENYDVRAFRWDAEYAAEYIQRQIRDRLHAARRRLSIIDGRYDSRAVTAGYIVDYDAHSPTYRHYIPYPPHAELVVREVFERFSALDGSVPALLRYWRAEGLSFPAFPATIDPRCAGRIALSVRTPDGGYALAERGLRGMLTNVVYIGEWVVDGEIVRRPDGSRMLAEPVLKDDDLFWWAFRRVSQYDMDGSPNTTRRFYLAGPARTVHEEVCPLLLRRKLRCVSHDRLLSYQVITTKAGATVWTYLSVCPPAYQGARKEPCLAIRSEIIDAGVAGYVLTRLGLCPDALRRAERLQDSTELARRRDVRTVEAKRSRLQAEIDGYFDILPVAPVADRHDILQRIAARKAEIAVLRETPVETIATPRFNAAWLAGALDVVCASWLRLPVELRATILGELVEVIDVSTPDRWHIGLALHWRHGHVDTLTLSRQKGSQHVGWSEEEDTMLRTGFASWP